MVLLIDNYDSFVFNLERYFVRLGQAVLVVRNDDLRLARALKEAQHGAPKPFLCLGIDPSALVISPGPKRPCDAGYCLELVQTLSGSLPILGICLGHQVIYEAFGGEVVRAKVPMHGRASPIRLGSSRLFSGLLHGGDQSQVEFARYHSLIAQPESLPQSLRVTAWSHDGEIMAVEHRSHDTLGVQFHPESILSPNGYRVLANFLHIAGLSIPAELPDVDCPTGEGNSILGLDSQATVAAGKLSAQELAFDGPSAVGSADSYRRVVPPASLAFMGTR
ncbi:MAG: aminodeoxychorismate/anthranilate synthase component II [Aureliella sp.]